MTFLKNHVFNEKETLHKKVVIVEEELDKTDKDNIGNFENLPLLWIKHFNKTARKFKPHWKHI